MSRWFRFYNSSLDDPKVQRLPGDLFKTWVNVLSVASRNDGRLPGIGDLAFMLRLSEEEAQEAMRELCERGLIDEDDDGWAPHNWKERQFQSDDSKERVRKHRERKRAQASNGDVTVTATPPDTDTDTDTEKEGESPQPPSAAGRAPRPKQATRLPEGWTPNERDRAAAVELGLSGSRLEWEAGKFRDYWAGRGGKDGRKLDWSATWRNWVRRAVEGGKVVSLPTAPTRPKPRRLTVDEHPDFQSWGNA